MHYLMANLSHFEDPALAVRDGAMGFQAAAAHV